MKPVSIIFRGGANDGHEFSASIPEVGGLQNLWRKLGPVSLELEHGAVHSTGREHIDFHGLQPAKEAQPAGGKYVFSIAPGTIETILCEWTPHNQPPGARPILCDVLESLLVHEATS